jgi:hypothetical protein
VRHLYTFHLVLDFSKSCILQQSPFFSSHHAVPAHESNLATAFPFVCNYGLCGMTSTFHLVLDFCKSCILLQSPFFSSHQHLLTVRVKFSSRFSLCLYLRPLVELLVRHLSTFYPVMISASHAEAGKGPIM